MGKIKPFYVFLVITLLLVSFCFIQGNKDIAFIISYSFPLIFLIIRYNYKGIKGKVYRIKNKKKLIQRKAMGKIKPFYIFLIINLLLVLFYLIQGKKDIAYIISLSIIFLIIRYNYKGIKNKVYKGIEKYKMKLIQRKVDKIQRKVIVSLLKKVKSEKEKI